MKTSALPRFLTADDVARELQVSRARAYEILRLMPHLVIGRSIRVGRATFDAFKRGRPAPIHDPLVYLIESGPGGPVKVGHCTNLNERLSRLQIGNPSELRVVARFAGGEREERELHRRLMSAHIRGEWFERIPAVEALIAELNGSEE